MAYFDEKERARITLQSIGDAVITTDLHENINCLNPVAERLTQWTLAEAYGKPLSEVCSLMDERTMQALPSRVAKALRDNRLCTFSGSEVALVRRDGSSVAIEDSAAPLINGTGVSIGGVIAFRDVTATRRMAQRITWAAAHDSLTGLVNRREFEARVEAALLSAHSSDRQHVMCYLDLDQFKVVNDSCSAPIYATGRTALGRQLPTADVGYPAAQLEGQLSGGEIAHPAVSCRPKGAHGGFLNERPVYFET